MLNNLGYLSRWPARQLQRSGRSETDSRRRGRLCADVAQYKLEAMGYDGSELSIATTAARAKEP